MSISFVTKYYIIPFLSKDLDSKYRIQRQVQ